MSTASATKASDKALACKKLTALLQKDYGKSLPKIKLPVLETMLFAVCLEDNAWEKAEASYTKLMKSYYDLNEIRVSSVSELERTLSDLKNAEWKGLRIRSILRFVFESSYTFEFEKLAKLTVESAQKRLKKIEFLSPFISSFTLEQVLGSHVVSLDDITLRAAIHLGVVPEGTEIDDASEFLKAGLKKTEAFGFTHLLRKLATDSKFESRITDSFDEEFDVLKVEECLAALKAPRKKKKLAPKAALEKVAPAATKEVVQKAASTAQKNAEPIKKKTVKGNKSEPTKSAASKSQAASQKKTSPSKKVAKKKR